MFETGAHHLKPLNQRSSKFRRTRYFSEFDDVIVKTFYFMFRRFSPLMEVGTRDFKGKIWFAFTEYQNPPRRSISTTIELVIVDTTAAPALYIVGQ